jgi:hypothetical protein
MAEHSPGQQLSEIASLIQDTVPELLAADIKKIVMEVAPIERTQRLLQLALIKQPGALQGEHPNVPITVQDLCHALDAAGARAIVLPACEGCGRHLRLPYQAPGEGRHCSRCARNHMSTPCARCGRVQPVQRNIDGERFCRTCWRADPRSFDTCSRCGQLATIVVRRPELVCHGCYTAPLRTCSLCHEPGRVATHLEGKRVCARCYYAMRRPRQCPECGRRRMLTNLWDDQLVCAECAGAPVTLACPGCGSVEESRKHHLCARCRRPIVVRRLLSDETGEIRDEMRPLAEYLISHHPRAESLASWVNKSRGAATLRELADGTLRLDPAAIIDRAGSAQSVSFLLSLLVQSGTLPDLDVQRARFEHWLRGWLASIEEPADRRLMRQYCAWGLNSASRSTPRATAKARYQKQRAALRYCAELLQFIRARGDSLMTFPQRELDAYLTGSPSQQDALAAFTRWLRQNRMSRLHVEHRKHQLAGAGFESDHRWRMARWFLQDKQISPVDRVAALLVLLYGIHLTRIVAIERTQVDVGPEQVTLNIGKEPIELPDALGESVTDLLNLSHHRSDRWLFVGRTPGAPLTAGALRRRLSRHGMQTRSARVTALLELAQQMHPRVLSDLLGISTTSATAWWRLAGGDWAAYPALR